MCVHLTVTVWCHNCSPGNVNYLSDKDSKSLPWILCRYRFFSYCQWIAFGADYVSPRLRDIENDLCSFTVHLPPPGITVTNSNSSRSLTCLHTSSEIRTTSLPQPAIYTTPSQAVIIIQIHSIAKVEGGGGGSREDEELQIISGKAFCLNPATSARDALWRLRDKQPMAKHKGKEKRDNKLFHLNPHREISLRNNQLLCCSSTAVELAISNLIVPSTLIPNADKYGSEVVGGERLRQPRVWPSNSFCLKGFECGWNESVAAALMWC